MNTQNTTPKPTQIVSTQTTNEPKKRGRKPLTEEEKEAKLKNSLEEMKGTVFQILLRYLCDKPEFTPTNRAYIEFIAENANDFGKKLLSDNYTLKSYISGLVDGLSNKKRKNQSENELAEKISDEFITVLSSLKK